MTDERPNKGNEGAFAAALGRSLGAGEFLLDSLGSAIIAHDLEGRVSFFNRAAEQLTGRNRKEIVGNRCHDVFDNGYCGQACLLDAKPKPTFEEAIADTIDVCHVGQDRHLQRTTLPVRDGDGQTVGVVIITRDSDDALERERAAKTLETPSVRPIEVGRLHGLVGEHAKMQELFSFIREVGPTGISVLVTGETGTGKERVAEALHAQSRRASGPFVPINCGALPENLLESELFGYRRGAFTGAVQSKRGRFEIADKGTLFLDEVGELTLAMQVKLLRVIEDRRVEPLGVERPVPVDVRIICATNRDLRKDVAAGRFREDLFFRLCVFPIHLPRLRERQSDIPKLAEYLLRQVCEHSELAVPRLTEETLEVLGAWRWPGNVRELMNALQFAAVRCHGADVEPCHLPPELFDGNGAAKGGRPRKLDRDEVTAAIEKAGGNKAKAAELLGVGRSTLYRTLREE